MDKISVLISLYKQETPFFFHECLESLSIQTRKPDQVVIVFDGFVGSDLEEVVDQFSSVLPIQVVSLSVNVGLAGALNAGLEHCSGNLVARFDSDDICYPRRLEVQERLINEFNVDILGSSATVINFDGVEVGTRINPVRHDVIIQNLWRNPLIHPSVMFRKERILDIGAYSNELRRRQDYELWFRAARNDLKFYNVKEPLIYYRFDSHTLAKQRPSLAWNQGKIGFTGSMSCNLGFIKSLCCFIPFFRSVFPLCLQVKITKVMKFLDSRDN